MKLYSSRNTTSNRHARRSANVADCSLRGIFRPFHFCLGLGLSNTSKGPS